MNAEVCDVCGSTDVKEIKCKLICQNCGTILRSCADLLVTGGFYYNHFREEHRHGS